MAPGAGARPRGQVTAPEEEEGSRCQPYNRPSATCPVSGRNRARGAGGGVTRGWAGGAGSAGPVLEGSRLEGSYNQLVASRG